MPAFNARNMHICCVCVCLCVLFYGAKNVNTNNVCYTKLLTRTYTFFFVHLLLSLAAQDRAKHIETTAITQPTKNEKKKKITGIGKTSTALLPPPPPTTT